METMRANSITCNGFTNKYGGRANLTINSVLLCCLASSLLVLKIEQENCNFFNELLLLCKVSVQLEKSVPICRI
jgi:hypothetical protein